MAARCCARSKTELRTRSARVVLVETSALDTFARTRKFYRECGYEQEARIREFYAEGEDKVVFRKGLNAAAREIGADT